MKENKTIRITLRLTPEQYDSIRSRAETAQMSVGAYVRAAADNVNLPHFNTLYTKETAVCNITPKFSPELSICPPLSPAVVVVCVADKEGTAMHDHMRAMKDQFFPDTDSYHRREVERLHSQLSQRLSRKNRRLLLHLMDEQKLLLEESSLSAFTAGFRSAVGLARELSQLTPYSFDKKERQAVSKIAPHKQRKAPQGQERE